MCLFVDKYCPKYLSELDFYLDQAQKLMNLAISGEIPHMLFYGPPGSGKKTRIMALLRELYGAEVDNRKLNKLHFTQPSRKITDVTIVSSKYHIEVELSEAGIDDRVVMMEFMQLLVTSYRLNSSCRILLITDVDRLTRDAQHAVRRTMEMYENTCHLIFSTKSLSQVIPVIKSRCLGMRVPAPTNSSIRKILKKIAMKEGLTLPRKLAKRISYVSGRNLRRAILILETCRQEQYPFTADQKVTELPWLTYLKDTAFVILSEQSPQNLLKVRERLYHLLTYGIPTPLIFQILFMELVKKCEPHLQPKVAELAARYEHQSHRGSKDIFHLEAFIANFMSLYLEE